MINFLSFFLIPEVFSNSQHHLPLLITTSGKWATLFVFQRQKNRGYRGTGGQVTIGRNVFSPSISRTGGCLWDERRYKKWIYSSDFGKPLEGGPGIPDTCLASWDWGQRERNRKALIGKSLLPLRGNAGPESAAAKDPSCGLEKLVEASMALKHWKQHSKNLTWDFCAPVFVHNKITVAFLATRYESSR